MFNIDFILISFQKILLILRKLLLIYGKNAQKRSQIANIIFEHK